MLTVSPSDIEGGSHRKGLCLDEKVEPVPYRAQEQLFQQTASGGSREQDPVLPEDRSSHLPDV